MDSGRSAPPQEFWMPRPKSLTSDEIAAAAIAVLDRGGDDALSIRAVAAELGMGTMSLYRYFESREQLEGLVVDLVFGQLNTSRRRASSWDDRVCELLARFRTTVSKHPAVVPLLLTHRFTSDAALPWAEAVLEALADGGFEGRQRSEAFRLLSAYTVGAIQAEHLGPMPGRHGELAADRHGDEYPYLAENAPYVRRATPSKEFRAGLDILLTGLTAGRDQ